MFSMVCTMVLCASDAQKHLITLTKKVYSHVRRCGRYRLISVSFGGIFGAFLGHFWAILAVGEVNPQNRPKIDFFF